MPAISEAVQVSLVSGVLMGSVPAGLAALVAWRGSRRTASELGDKIGEPNGHGNVVRMLTTILAGQAGQDERLARLEDRQHDLGGRVGQLERAVGPYRPRAG